MSENLLALRRLTSELPSLTELVREACANTVEYDTAKGRITGRGLMKSPEVAVQDLCYHPDTEFVRHYHDEHEWLVPYSGEIVVCVGDEEEVFGYGDCAYIPPRTSHCSRSHEMARVIAITVPASPGYPDQ